jgi:phosphate transport system permease protein
MKSKVIFVLTLACLLFLFFPFSWILFDLIVKGLPVILSSGINFLTGIPPIPGDGIGGIGTVIEGSLFIVSIATLISIPISLLTSIYIVMNEGKKLSRISRFLVETVLEFPTIIVGISVFMIFAVGLGLGLNGLTGAIALGIIMIPYSTVQTVENLRQAKEQYLEVGYSLGLTDSRVVRLLISEGREGVTTGILIGLAKIFGETAPLLFTTVTSFNIYLRSINSPVSGIPVLIFNYAFSPYDNWHDVAWGASLVLALIVLLLFILTRVTTRRR